MTGRKQQRSGSLEPLNHSSNIGKGINTSRDSGQGPRLVSTIEPRGSDGPPRSQSTLAKIQKKNLIAASGAVSSAASNSSGIRIRSRSGLKLRPISNNSRQEVTIQPAEKPDNDFEALLNQIRVVPTTDTITKTNKIPLKKL